MPLFAGLLRKKLGADPTAKPPGAPAPKTLSGSFPKKETERAPGWRCPGEVAGEQGPRGTHCLVGHGNRGQIRVGPLDRLSERESVAPLAQKTWQKLDRTSPAPGRLALMSAMPPRCSVYVCLSLIVVSIPVADLPTDFPRWESSSVYVYVRSIVLERIYQRVEVTGAQMLTGKR
jgi:hypothetical protein